MVWVGKNLFKGHLVQPPCNEQGCGTSSEVLYSNCKIWVISPTVSSVPWFNSLSCLLGLAELNLITAYVSALKLATCVTHLWDTRPGSCLQLEKHPEYLRNRGLGCWMELGVKGMEGTGTRQKWVSPK